MRRVRLKELRSGLVEGGSEEMVEDVPLPGRLRLRIGVSFGSRFTVRRIKPPDLTLQLIRLLCQYLVFYIILGAH